MQLCWPKDWANFSKQSNSIIFGDKRKNSHTMRVVIQRVSEASVTIDGQIKSSIDSGLLILLGIEDIDTPAD